MPIPGALAGGTQTTIRGGGNFTRYLAPHTPTVMLSFNPSVNASGKNNGSITYSSALSGTDTNVLKGMTVVISPTADYESDLKNDYENCHISYARAAATSTTLAIGMTNFQWTTAQFVTVLDTFAVHEKPILVASGVISKDFNITFRKPLPRIYGLYWDVVIASGATYDYSPTPSAVSMDKDGTITTWAWQVIEGGVLTHTSSSQNPTFTLDTGTHWLHLTVTDSFGNTNWFAALIAVVPSDYSSVVHQSDIGSVDNDLNNGISADLVAYGDVSTWIPGSAALVFIRAVYADATDAITVEMAGWLSTISETLTGDDTFGQDSQFSAKLIGVAEAMQPIQLPGYPVTELGGTVEWGDFTLVTPYISAWYAASEHSTVTNVAAFDFPSNYADYRFGTVDVPSGSLDDILAQLVTRAEGGLISWSPHGEIIFRKSLLYETVAATRDSAVVYATYATQDGAIINPQLPPANIFAFNTIIAGAASYNTTTKRPTPFASQAPGGFVPGALLEEIDGIILEKDLNLANAGAAAGQFAANHFFTASDSTLIELSLKGGYHALVPSGYQWHKMTMAATDWLYGLVFDSNTRFICLRRSATHNAADGALEIRITLRKETDGGSNYAPEIEFLPTQTSQEIPDYPIASFYPGIADADLSDDTYGDGFGDNNAGWQDDSLPDEQAAEETGPDSSALEVLRIPFRGGTISSGALTSAAAYLLRISGEALIQNKWTHTFDFTVNDSGWVDLSNFHGGPAYATYTPGTGWTHTDTARRPGSGTESRAAGIMFDYTVGSSVITRIAVTFDLTKGSYTFSTDPALNIQDTLTAFPGSSSVLLQVQQSNAVSGSGQTEVWTGTSSTGRVAAAVFSSADTTAPFAFSGSATIRKITLSGTGPNPFSGATETGKRGDAFYQDYQDGAAATAYATGKGLQIDSGDPSPVPPYKSDHTYEYALTGDGTTVDFAYVDPDGDATDNDDKHIRIEIFKL